MPNPYIFRTAASTADDGPIGTTGLSQYEEVSHHREKQRRDAHSPGRKRREVEEAQPPDDDGAEKRREEQIHRQKNPDIPVRGHIGSERTTDLSSPEMGSISLGT